ncbi:hypothetical protein [Rhizohabitans arisaemae]|uniref:hypothetical protein n=1 Tax=Rhizohabitans arisaemae TaxID=2720610 RepID=UPI0024B1CF19|nr:hypothetical protein [Rhizohabitans arisaemae]
MVAFMALAAACGGSDAATSSSEPDRPTSAPAPTSAVAPPAASPVEPRGGTTTPQPVRWTSAVPVGDGRTLRVTWTSGVEPCYTLDRVNVVEDDRTVEVTVWEGQDSRVQNVACIDIAVAKTTTIRLDAPLGNRTVIDGTGE